MDILENAFNTLKGTVQTNQNILLKLKNDFEMSDNNLNGLKSTVQTNQNILLDLKEEVKGISSSVNIYAGVSNRVTLVENSLGVLKSDVSSINSSIKNFGSRITNSESLINTITGNVSSMDLEVKSIGKLANTNLSNISSILSQVSSLQRFENAQNVWNDALERRVKDEELATKTFNDNFTDIRDRRRTLFSSNLNDVYKTGDYYAYGVTNQPTGMSNIGFLSVISNDQGVIMQEYTAYNDPKKNKYTRVRNGATWSAWTSNVGDLQEQIDAEKARWRAINNTDLDTFFDVGRFYTYGTKNMPVGVNASGYLFVTGTGALIMQEYTAENDPQITYSRVRKNGNWSAWKSSIKELQKQIDDEKSRWAVLTSKDLNTVMTTGMYASYTSTNMPSGVSKDGYLTVNGGGSYVYQSYTPVNDPQVTYTRRYLSGNWSVWKSSTEDLQKQIDDEKSRWSVLTSKDLNTVMTTGMYASYTSTNMPSGVSKDGYLTVNGGGSYVYQSYTPVNEPQVTYTRRYSSGNWSQWKSSTGDLQKQIDDEKSRWSVLTSKDLNTVMTTGMYASYSSVNMPSGVNKDGYLTVNGGGSYVYQSYTPVNEPQSTYTRRYSSGNWSVWTKTSISASEFETVKNRVDDLVGKVATNIDDIRDLKNGVSSLNAWKNVQLAWNALQEVEIAGVKKDIGGLKEKDTDLQNQINKFESRYKNLSSPDLNNVKTSGSYYVSSAINAPKGVNNWGYLTVISKDMPQEDSPLIQEYSPDSSSKVVYRRIFHMQLHGGWSDWVDVSVSKSDIDDLKLQINEEKSRRRGLYSVDINTIKRTGNYYVSNGINTPPNLKWGYLSVIASTDDIGGAVQEYVPDSQPYRKFRRIYHQSVYDGWSDWINVSVTKDDIDLLKQGDVNQQNQIDSLKKKDSDQQQQINTSISDISTLKAFNVAQTAWNLKQELDNQSQDERITALENFDWMEVIDLVAVVHAIDVVRDRVTETRDLFKNGGEFYALMAMQHADTVQKFDLLNTTIKLQFSSYFGTNGIFWLSAKTFSDSYIVSFMQALTVTLNQQWQRNWADITSIWGITNQALSVNNNRLELIYGKLSEIAGRPIPIQNEPFEFDYKKLQEMLDGLEIKTSDLNLKNVEDWLKKIFDKKGFEFDYDKLQTMLSKLEFGNVINEAGTNVWDFLSELVDTLGKGLEDILDFLESMTDKLIALVVPDNLDFIDQKFDSTASTIKLKFSFVFGWIDTFKNLFGNQVQFEDVELNLGSMFDGKSTSATLPLSVINDFAPIAKMVITGFVLLEFLIDMYKWFHTRGEVIE